MIRLAAIGGERRQPFRGGRGSCPTCGQRVLAKCGNIRIHHWAHESAEDCDPWSEGVGPWHLSWQDLIWKEYIEVPMGGHRADILGDQDIVIELQHSPLSPDVIKLREAFYGEMVWVFDATRRFFGVHSGDRFFFSLGRHRHIYACTKPVYLDFGVFIVQVEVLREGIGRFSGLGWVRDRQWFIERYLSEKRNELPMPPASREAATYDWPGKQPWQRIPYPTIWQCTDSSERQTLPSGSVCIPLQHWAKSGAVAQRDWSSVVDSLPAIANGWTKPDLREMMQFLTGTPMIIDGKLRLLPAAAEKIAVTEGVDRIRELLQRADGHIQKGRIPVLKPSTRSFLLEKAKMMEFGRSHYLAR